VEVSVDAHFEAMKMMRPGLYEYQVAARMQFIHMNAGCLEEAYAPIVGAGVNSTALHYDALESKIEDGDIVVLDVACAQDGYAADITRTLPASGHFSPRQREIYEIVLGAQNAAIAAVKPGARMSREDSRSPVSVAFEYINTHGKDRQGGALGKYYIHGLSHPIGLDVHDPYVPVVPRSREHPDMAGRKSVPLDPASVASYDALLIVTDHDNVDYVSLAKSARLIVDTRNACARAGAVGPHIVKA